MKAVRGVALAAAAVIFCLTGGPALAAAESGSAQDAKAMLERAVAAIKTDEPKALAAFNHGDDGFRDRDLYVFCAKTNGTVDAHVDPTQIGRKLQDLYDVDGVSFGVEMMAVAREGKITAVDYMWPRPGSHTPAQKVSFVTKVADQICGVGFYK